MIISAKETDDRFQFDNPGEQYPSFAKIAGYMLEALFLDGLYSDIERLDRVNHIIRNSGDREIKTDNKTMKYVDYLIISPLFFAYLNFFLSSILKPTFVFFPLVLLIFHFCCFTFASVFFFGFAFLFCDFFYFVFF